MATMAASSVFVDTNILVYPRSTSSVWHGAAVARMNQMTAAGMDLYISRQILREYLGAMTRSATGVTPPALSALIADVHVFLQHLRIVEDNAAITARLLNLLSQVACAGKQVHDANIVATMLAHGIGSLLTNNPSDFNRFAGFVTVLPLVPPAPPPVPKAAPPPPTPGAP